MLEQNNGILVSGMLSSSSSFGLLGSEAQMITLIIASANGK